MKMVKRHAVAMRYIAHLPVNRMLCSELTAQKEITPPGPCGMSSGGQIREWALTGLDTGFGNSVGFELYSAVTGSYEPRLRPPTNSQFSADVVIPCTSFRAAERRVRF